MYCIEHICYANLEPKRYLKNKNNIMFRKLIANLSFSPALIHQVGFYAGRLRKEESTRRLTLIFMVMALIVQSMAVFSPPESANASSEQDLLRGGVSSKEDFVMRYNANESNIKDIFTAAGVTSTEIEALEPGSVNTKDNVFVMGRVPRFGNNGGEVSFTYAKSDTGQVDTTYMSPLSLWDTTEAAQQFGTSYQGFIGQSDKLGWFAVLKNCGNLVTKVLPAEAIKPNPNLKQELSAVNLSQGSVAADTVVAQAGDRISYTVRATNSGTSAQLTPLVVALDDVLEYGTLLDNGNALLEDKSHLLSWSPVSIAPGQSEQRSFVVQLLDPLPAVAQGESNATSYDCVLTSAYGTSLHIKVQCPASKDIETIMSFFPTIGTTGNIIFGIVVGGLVVFFYLRTRQLKEEIRLIRHSLNEGTI